MDPFDMGEGNKVTSVEKRGEIYIVNGHNNKNQPRSIQIHPDGSIRNYLGNSELVGYVEKQMKANLEAILKHFEITLPKQQREIGVSVETPTKGVSSETPTQKVSVETPTKGVSSETPTQKVSVETPTKGVSSETPTQKVSVETPTKGVSSETPIQKVSVETPTKGVSSETPTQKVSLETPIKGVSSETPTQRVSSEAPISQKQEREQPKISEEKSLSLIERLAKAVENFATKVQKAFEAAKEWILGSDNQNRKGPSQ
ncbi:TPA: hypothetical protein I8Z75_002348 [Legionella pneumophila]|uniref:hypothetical protein n=4 Tax=Legionella pneumophila TaxID=446 RepID=UPI000777EEF5|nr:hypothetical protein [Legionella pneumophila]STX99394.1 Uncharacterised protein [Legionella pneumophila]HAT1776250.1 hypothetical protein [Legionella pneumophila]HAT1779272.1 hypothetical protein [Legionella pneumophila]HAT2019410.1 hypothetical protein [Legionella pneumophila]HAT2025469.1 hypothetical protein [Legionella pneumophila]